MKTQKRKETDYSPNYIKCKDSSRRWIEAHKEERKLYQQGYQEVYSQKNIDLKRKGGFWNIRNTRNPILNYISMWLRKETTITKIQRKRIRCVKYLIARRYLI